ncbi:MAG: hypothetical protein ACRELE_05515, partial [Gemmatimonadales bacterium]
MIRARHASLAAFLLAPSILGAQAKRPPAPQPDPWAVLLRPTTSAPTPTTTRITAADLRTRLFAFADDSMQGRRTGTIGNVKGVEYIASEVRRFGLQPAGQDGTFFQTVHVPVERRTFDSTATIAVDGVPLVPWTDYLPRDPDAALLPVDGVQVIYGGTWQDSNSVIATAQAAGKFVLITSTATAPGNPPGIPTRPDVASHFRMSAGVAVVGLEQFPASVQQQYRQPGFGMRTDQTAPAYLYVTRSAAERLLGAPLATATPGMAGKTLTGALRYVVQRSEVPFAEPVRNVVALLPGSDPALQGEFVVIGAHNDHIGT